MTSNTPLTDLLLRKIKTDGAERVEVWDDRVPGLGVRVSSAGTKSFVLLYRLDCKAKRMTLGRYPVLSLLEARELAQQALNKLTKGDDPQAERQEKRSYPRFDEVFSEFLRLHCDRKNRENTARETERVLRSRFLTKWASKDLRGIRKHDVLAVIDGILDEGKPSAANHAFAAIRKLFSWSVTRGIVEVNPCTGIGMPAAAVERERVLSNDELVAVWRAASTTGYPYGTIVKLLILTAQRRNEVTGMRWSEIDREAATWSMPAERVKNGRFHQIPLPPTACALIDAVPRANEAFVFPARGNGDRSFSGFSKLKARLDEVSGVSDWTLHDLRRTAATGLAGLGVSPHVVEKLLNHTTGALGGVAGIYNRFQYMPEMRAALLKWERHIEALVAAQTEPRSAPVNRVT